MEGITSSFDAKKSIDHTVRAAIITELILERAGPIIFETFLMRINSFQTDSNDFSCKKSKA